jgi:hypothetical protein
MSITTRQMTRENAHPTPEMARTILRTDDAPRLPCQLRPEDHERTRASSADTRLRTDLPSFKRRDPSMADTPTPDDASTPPRLDSLSAEKTIELFKQKVKDAQQDTQNALAGSEDVREVVRPKLTLDLGHKNITRLPEEVVDLIKSEVESLSLSQNQIMHIPPRFSECSHLHYLNIRSNVFREIPKGVRLPQHLDHPGCWLTLDCRFTS